MRKTKGVYNQKENTETKYRDLKILYLSYLYGDCSLIVVGFKCRQKQIIFIWRYLNHS